MKKLIPLILAVLLPMQAWGGSQHYTTSTAYESNHVIEGAAGNLFWFTVLNHSTTAMMLMIFNATSAPGDGAVTPTICLPVPPATAQVDGFVSSINPLNQPVQFGTGITAVLSSGQTCVTKTATANGWFMFSSQPQ